MAIASIYSNLLVDVVWETQNILVFHHWYVHAGRLLRDEAGVLIIH